jgi:predicted nucleotidyltransferase
MVEKITNYDFAILSLYRNNYNSSYHARAMAKLLKTSHVTLLPHLKRLEKNKILITRKVGKNKEYLLNADNIITKDYLTIAEKLEAINYLQKNFLIKKISEQLLTLNLPGAIILFGSYAKNYATQASDIDILYLGELTDTQKLEIKKIGRTYGKEINVKTATAENFSDGLKSGDALIKEIVQNHIGIQNPEQFINLSWRHYTGK